MPAFKAVLFDKDGVLIDSLGTCHEAFNSTLEAYGLSKLTREEYIRLAWGPRATDILLKMFGSGRLDEALCFYRKQEKDFSGKKKPYMGAAEVLTILKSRGLKLGVVTNSPRAEATETLDKFGLSRHLDVLVSGDDAKPKPSPEPLQKACFAIGAKPQETLYIGDTLTDIKAGIAAGCKTLIVTNTMSKSEAESYSGVMAIADIRDVLKVV